MVMVRDARLGVDDDAAREAGVVREMDVLVEVADRAPILALTPSSKEVRLGVDDSPAIEVVGVAMVTEVRFGVDDFPITRMRVDPSALSRVSVLEANPRATGVAAMEPAVRFGVFVFARSESARLMSQAVRFGVDDSRERAVAGVVRAAVARLEVDELKARVVGATTWPVARLGVDDLPERMVVGVVVVADARLGVVDFPATSANRGMVVSDTGSDQSETSQAARDALVRLGVDDCAATFAPVASFPSVRLGVDDRAASPVTGVVAVAAVLVGVADLPTSSVGVAREMLARVEDADLPASLVLEVTSAVARLGVVVFPATSTSAARRAAARLGVTDLPANSATSGGVVSETESDQSETTQTAMLASA